MKAKQAQEDNAEQYAVDTITQSIEAYLIMRPDSADTLEGIHRWWIDRSEFEVPLAMTLAALEALQNRGLVEQVRVGKKLIWRRAVLA